jgi:hypothetical protein
MDVLDLPICDPDAASCPVADVRWVDARAWTTMDEDVAAGGKALRFGKGDVGLIRIRDAN